MATQLLHVAIKMRGCRVVSLVGGGGKTTALFLLAKELVAQGAKVIVTTTTKIYKPTPEQVKLTIVSRDAGTLCQATEDALRETAMIAVGKEIEAEGKLSGVPPAWVADLAKLADYVLVEADGAKGKPFKAPASHEPVIPESTALTIVVVGIEVVGQVLSEVSVQRPERVSAITGLALGDVIMPKDIATAILHPDGLGRPTPLHRQVLLLNKVDSEEQLAQGRAIGELVLSGGLSRVVLARLQTPLIWEVMT
jgi:probable selenium-dependent hydroxylase accessory protein YqeC